MNEVILHGECMVFPSELSKEAKRVETKDSFVIVAESETTGNHHVVDVVDGCDFFEDKGILFLKNSKPTKIRCTQATRHDAITLEPGTWEFGIQKEFDPFTENLRNVKD